MEALRSNEQRGKNAIALIWIVLILDVACLISGYFQYSLLQRIINGAEISEESINANNLREQLVSLAYIAVYIVSAITFILWFRRAYFNLHQKVSYLSDTEGWAAGAWFVPVYNLYKPYQIMKELYVSTRELLHRNGFMQELSTGLLGVWWMLWIVSNVTGQVASRYARKAIIAEDVATATEMAMVSNLISIPLAIITIKVIKNYTQVEPLIAMTRGEEDPAPADSIW